MLRHSFATGVILLLAAEACLFINAADIPQCGKSKVGAPRIVGGAAAVKGAWPWQIAIMEVTSTDSQFLCGGTLIFNQWVLTASHCFKGKSLTASGYRVALGKHNIRQSEGSEIMAAVSKITLHPQYDSATYLNDIALMKLSQPINLNANPYINVACLPKAADKFVGNSKCYSTGWGVTQAQQSPSLLQVVTSTVISHTDCKKHWASVTDQTKICFGNGLKGACRGDSGGPLSCARSDGAYVVAGVVSFGNVKCTQQPYPTVYSNVAAYRGWITSVTGL